MNLGTRLDDAHADLDRLDLTGDGDGPDQFEEDDVVGQRVMGPEGPGRTPNTPGQKKPIIFVGQFL